MAVETTRQWFIDPDGDVYWCPKCGALMNRVPKTGIDRSQTMVWKRCAVCAPTLTEGRNS